ncbi:MAG: recombinase family protein [Beijerinckiaceae bacterium]|nr:recombinase family protein [Beijerinckiaceae bacterium]
MLIGYMRVSKTDGSQVVDLQSDALVAAGVAVDQLYTDRASGKRDDRPGLEACLRSLRDGDTLMVWKLDRLGRNLKHLVDVVQALNGRGVGLKVLTGQGAAIDTTTANGRLMFNFFAALAEFERELIVERTNAGLAAARARGRNGGRPFKMTSAKLRLAQAAMGKPETKIAELCAELGVTRQTLYRHVAPTGDLRPDGEKLLGRKSRSPRSRSVQLNAV